VYNHLETCHLCPIWHVVPLNVNNALLILLQLISVKLPCRECRCCSFCEHLVNLQFESRGFISRLTEWLSTFKEALCCESLLVNLQSGVSNMILFWWVICYKLLGNHQSESQLAVQVNIHLPQNWPPFLQKTFIMLFLNNGYHLEYCNIDPGDVQCCHSFHVFLIFHVVKLKDRPK
jgi:hypothetical protein